MSAKSYNFTIGEIECAVLLDGASNIEVERFLARFPEGTEAEYRQAFAEIGSALEEATSSMNILVAKMGDEVILVDAGMGYDSLAAMAETDFSPDDITLVVITHAHGDHVLGLLNEAGESNFPNAQFVISKDELIYWQGRISTDRAAQKPILTMMQTQGLRLIDMEENIIDGVTAMPIPGHTPGQIALLFESDGEKLLHMADLLHSPMQFAHPEWSAKFDADTSVSVPTRQKALQRATDENLLTLFYHLEFPGLGSVKTGKQGFIWEPIV